jgi:hypothetical protein
VLWIKNKLRDLIYMRINNHFKKTMDAKEKADSLPFDLAKIHTCEDDCENKRDEWRRQ